MFGDEEIEKNSVEWQANNQSFRQLTWLLLLVTFFLFAGNMAATWWRVSYKVDGWIRVRTTTSSDFEESKER